MEFDILRYLLPYSLSMIKFVAGPTIGLAVGLSIIEIIIVTTAGMMSTVVLLSYAGQPFREWVTKKFMPEPKRFSKRNRRFVRVWRKYGAPGVSFLTPLILTPVGGTLLLVAVGEKRKRIISFMLVSGVIWAVLQTFFFKFFADQVSTIWF
jgi:hypothetical protein